MGSGALPVSTSEYLPTPLWLNSWTNTSCSQSDIPFYCNCIYWLVSKDHYNGLFFSTCTPPIGPVAIIIPKQLGDISFPPRKKQHNAQTYMFIYVYYPPSVLNDQSFKTRPVLGNLKYKVRYQAFLQSSDVRIKRVGLEDQVIHHEAVDAFSASLQEVPLILNKFPANQKEQKKGV